MLGADVDGAGLGVLWAIDPLRHESLSSMTKRTLPIALLAAVLASSPAYGQCLGFDAFPVDDPRNVVAAGMQKAYIYHANGVERIVLQPSYRGAAKDFGLFFAVPEIPVLDKADPALFHELMALTAPPPTLPTIETAVTADVVDSWEGVSVVKEELVGMYEVMVLQASSAASFTDWLAGHGYQWPAGMDAVFQHYVDKGWFFLAMKVRPDSPAASGHFMGPIQPVSVRFTQDEIVMPMRMTSLTPGGVDFAYFLITDHKVKARNIEAKAMLWNERLRPETVVEQGLQNPHLAALLAEDLLLTRQDDLALTLQAAGVSATDLATVRRFMGSRLWISRFQGHFDLEDLGDDFVWDPIPGTATTVEGAKAGVLAAPLAEALVHAHTKGMRQVDAVTLLALAYDTNVGFGKPTFINGIHVGDLASIGREGSDRWQTIVMDLPRSVAHWLGEEVTVRIDNYGKEVPGKGRQADAYNLKNVRIHVDYDDGTHWESKWSEGTVCSVPTWEACEGQPVRQWGDPVEIRL